MRTYVHYYANKETYGKIGHIPATTHRIDLIHGARSFESTTYRDGPKERAAEEFKIKRQLAAGVIENSNAKWTVHILFEPKKHVRLQLCVE